MSGAFSLSERARPRAQQASNRTELENISAQRRERTLLRPRTGALRSFKIRAAGHKPRFFLAGLT